MSDDGMHVKQEELSDSGLWESMQDADVQNGNPSGAFSSPRLRPEDGLNLPKEVYPYDYTGGYSFHNQYMDRPNAVNVVTMDSNVDSNVDLHMDSSLPMESAREPVLYGLPPAGGSGEYAMNPLAPSVPVFGDSSPQIKEEEECVEAKDKKPRAKSAHNLIEQRYRNKMNEKFQVLRDSVPVLREYNRLNGHEEEYAYEDAEEASVGMASGMAPVKKLNKGIILTKSIEYIKYLESKNQRKMMEYQQLLERAEMLGYQVRD